MDVLVFRMTLLMHAMAMWQVAAGAQHHGNPFVQFVFRFGLAGLPVISAIDSSFVPLPIPGVTDILIIIYAASYANHWANLVLLVGLATVGSAAGGWFSHWVGHKGGTAFLEKHVPARILKSVTVWMEKHAILAVALPALLPPPMPLSPFVLVAGASNMSRRKFMTAFTVSRFIRHALAAWIGVHYGRHVIHWWNLISRKWGTPVLAVIWSVMIVFAAVAIWKLWQTSREMKGRRPGAAVTT